MTAWVECAILDNTHPTMIQALVHLTHPEVCLLQWLPCLIQLSADLLHDDDKWAQPPHQGQCQTLPITMQQAGQQVVHMFALPLPLP